MSDQEALFQKGEWWQSYWHKMPEFIQEDLAPKETIQVNFRNQDDLDTLLKLVGNQKINAQGSIWFPESEIGRTAGKYYAVSDPYADPNPIYPVYIISKGRWDSRLTSKALERLRVPYHIVVEPQEYYEYARVIDPAKILQLPFENYNQGQGSIPVRNWIWDHARSIGAKRHWCVDDNIESFCRLNQNLKIPVRDGMIFRVMEDYVDRFTNVAIAGPNYFMFASRKSKLDPFTRNTRIYSCILIRNDIEPMGERWRGRYNEDTDLSIRALKEGWATILFNAFLAVKSTTMTMKGGNTDELYDEKKWAIDEASGMKYNIGRKLMAESLAAQHPDIVKVTTKWDRYQHHVDYSGFKQELIWQPDQAPEFGAPLEVNNFGMELHYDPTPRSRAEEPELPPIPLAEIVCDNSGPLPSLNGVSELAIDTETTAEKDFYQHTLWGISYYLPDGRKGYLPIAHPGGGNYPPDNVRAWAKGELRGKELVAANAGHEVETFLRFGVDLEAQGNRMRDVFHQAALVNDHRTTIMECEICRETYPALAGACLSCGSDEGHSLGRVNLKVLAREELNKRTIEIDHMKLWSMPAERVAPVAIEDAETTWQLREFYQPTIEAEGLQEVLDLEDDLVYCVAEMERNGTYLDVPLLERYKIEITMEYESRLQTIYEATGFKGNLRGWKGMEKLFNALHLEYGRTADGTPSFPEDFLLTINHPIVQTALETRQLANVLSKFVDPYLALHQDGRLRYRLHQLAGDEHGTITGRFSASDPNIQQVSKNSKQPPLIQRWPIRACFIPGPEDDGWLSADASQIEFRRFAHYCAKHHRPRLAKKYQENPWIDFHTLVAEWTRIIRDYAKNVNFCKLYGGGAEKIAYMINSYRKPGAPTVSVEWVEEHVVEPYDAEFPEARWLIGKASQQAKDLGFVRTSLGRRRRFGKSGERYYAALNCVIQGDAADINKRKLLELYRNRKALGLTMRFTVHDEVDGGLKDRMMLAQVQALLNEQTTDSFVPILWEAKVKENWHAAH